MSAGPVAGFFTTTETPPISVTIAEAVSNGGTTINPLEMMMSEKFVLPPLKPIQQREIHASRSVPSRPAAERMKGSGNGRGARAGNNTAKPRVNAAGPKAVSHPDCDVCNKRNKRVAEVLAKKKADAKQGWMP